MEMVEGDSSASPRNDRIKGKSWGEEAVIRSGNPGNEIKYLRIAASSLPRVHQIEMSFRMEQSGMRNLLLAFPDAPGNPCHSE
jgi:hypothetical protein